MDTTPIVARLSVIADSVSALQDMQEVALEEFVADDILHTAAEHYFQVAIQAALDIGGMLLAVRSVKVPQGYADIFPALAEAGVLPKDFARPARRHGEAPQCAGAHVLAGGPGPDVQLSPGQAWMTSSGLRSTLASYLTAIVSED